MPPPPPRRRPAGALDPEVLRDRARGALLGLSVGNALGAPQEGKVLPAPPFPELCGGPQTELVGGGPSRIRPGQVTDDAQMASVLALSLRVVKGYSPEDALQRYRSWLPHAFDAGKHTRAVLEGYRQPLGPFFASREHWTRSGKRAAGNGSLMRTAPIGVAFAQDRAERVRASLEDSALTHFDPRCALACATLNALISAALLSPGTPEPKRLVSVAAGELAVAAAELGRQQRDFVREVQDATAALKEDLELAQRPDPELYGPFCHLHHHAGFVRVAFRLALWELFHAPTFEAGLLDVVNRGGDADTQGAVTGALLGAVHGEAAIPARWRSAVLQAAPPSPALRDTWHPTQLLTLAD